MPVLVAGLLLFLGVHSVRVFGDAWRAGMIARIGEGRWKGAYALASAVGLALVVWGYGMARSQPTVLWTPPAWALHVAAPLTVIAFILITATYVPGNRIKAAVGHPMLIGVQAWAVAHLIANGTLRAVVLFGAFLIWAIVDFISARRRGGVQLPPEQGTSLVRDGMVFVIGLAAWVLFAFKLHGWVAGVRPFG